MRSVIGVVGVLLCCVIHMGIWSTCSASSSTQLFNGPSQSLRGSKGIPVFVMLPLDVVSMDNTLNNEAQLNTWLGQLKNVGVTGVESDVWWGVVEQDGPKQYNFSAYEQLVKLIRSNGLQFKPVMSFHRCGGNVGDKCNVPLPKWVRDMHNQHDIFYKDQQGNIDEEYLSLFVDEEPLFQGRTAADMYEDFMNAFASTFSNYIDDKTISQIEIGLGPAGEMRYPSYQLSRWQFCGIGEFQCYDSFALKNLSAAAKAAGRPEWGHGGPDNAGTYDSHPQDTQFFTPNNQNENNYQSDYGRFFINWYSQSLLDHGRRILSRAWNAFGGKGVRIGAKVAGIHWWYKYPSHAAEVTAGYYNTNNNNAYKEIADMLQSVGNGVDFDFTCLEMLDSSQPPSCDCGPYELVQQAKQAADIGIGFSGENALPRFDQQAYNTIEKQASSDGYLLEGFAYLRLGPKLMQQNNLDRFGKFVQTMNNLQPSL